MRNRAIHFFLPHFASHYYLYYENKNSLSKACICDGSCIGRTIALLITGMKAKLTFHSSHADYTRSVCTTARHGQPQWGAADAEIKVPSDENTELKGSPLVGLE